ncbi:MAG: aminofutalosine synthase MqnE [Ignavibacteria bacterium]|nr:aminofutalosine synthase MqnE [Ignavibacteria bacterium]
MINFKDKSLIPIWEKVQSGQELTFEDGITLYNSPDLLSIGKMAHWLQREKSGEAVYFVVNQKIEPTNICVLSCKFCDFAVKKNSPEAYEMTIEAILEKLNPELLEVHITGGLHPDWEWDYYVNMVREIKKHFPRIDVKAFTAVEIDFFSKKFKKSIEEVLLELKEAGLRTLPGGGAEVFSERVRRLLFNQKIGAKRWLEIHKTAHQLGIRSNATLLYGHIETIEERVKHFLLLRDLQKETGGFLSFIPLAFQPGDTGIKPRNQFTSAIDDLKTIAVSRLMLHNFDHIKAYWVMLTEELAAVALNFGADDMDGTVGGERIAHDAGAISPMQLAKNKLIKIINDANKIPVERDIFYKPVKLHSNNIIGRVSYLNTLPFFKFLDNREYKIFPAPPRQLGFLFKDGNIDAGIVSLVDYFERENDYSFLKYGIVGNKNVKSVILYSKHPIEKLDKKSIAVTDETSTSFRLLQVLLEMRYGLDVVYVREKISAREKNLPNFDAFLTIGDDALRFMKHKIEGFDYVYDLAQLWYEWQKLPFVFAVWAFKKDIAQQKVDALNELLNDALNKFFSTETVIEEFYNSKIGLSKEEIKDYLNNIVYRLGEDELRAINIFKDLYLKLNQKNLIEEKSFN